MADIVRPIIDQLADEYDVVFTLAGPEDMSSIPYREALTEAVAREVAGIAIVGWGDDKIVPEINRAVARDIPVLTLESDIPDSARLACVGTDWYRMGGAMADDLATRIGGRGEVLVIGWPGPENVASGIEGYRRRLQAYSNVKIIEIDHENDIDHYHPRETIARCLERYPSLSGIAALDGAAVIGATRAVMEAGLTEKIKIIGIDNEPEHLELLRRGAIDSLFSRKQKSLIYLAFQMLYSYRHGSAATGYLPGPVNIPGDIKTGYVLITRKNIDTYESEFGNIEAFRRHELHQRLSLLSGIMENSAEIALAADREGRLVYANRAACYRLGLDDRNISRKTIDDLFRLDNLQKKKIADCLGKGTTARFELSVTGNEGADRLYQISISPLHIGQAIGGMVLNASDVSALNEARSELSRSETRYLNLFEKLNDAVFVHDLEGNILDVNRMTLEMFGYFREEILSLKIGDMHPPEAEERSRQAFEDIRRDGFVKFEIPFKKKDGSVFWGEVSSSLFNLDDKQVVQGVVRDVTSRKEIEKALLESEERYRTFVQDFPGIAFRGTIDFKPIFFHGAVEKMTGYTEKQFLDGKVKWEQLIHPEDREIITNANSRLVENREFSTSDEYRIRHRDGSIRWVRGYIRNLNDASGHPAFVQGVLYDITERKQAEKARRESDERFRTFFRTSPDVLTISRLEDGRIFDVNEKFEEISGYSREEAIGKTAFEIELWADPDIRRKVVENIREKGSFRNIEVKFRRKDGQLRNCLMSGNIISLKGKSYLFSAVRDIEELIRTQDALQSSEERFRTVFEAARDAIFIKDCDLKYVAVNPSLAHLFGMEPEQFIGRTFQEIFGDHNAELYRKSESRVLNGEIITSERPFAVKGEEHTLHVVIVPMKNIRGEIKGLCGIARDITEIRRLQEFEMRARRLEAAGKIAGQVAHDFNNLLGPLIAYPALMQEELPQNHPVLEYLADIEKAAEQMAEINQQLLTLGRRGHYNMEPININESITLALERLKPYPDNIEVVTSLADDLMNIKGGSAQIYRVISNLVVNSFDAMPRGGKLRITSKNYYVVNDFQSYGRIPRGEYVKLTVSDNGIGIDPDIRPRIFDPFFTTKKADRKRGSGLGLSIVHAVIEDHNGYIDLESRPGAGTSFYLYFPITREMTATVNDTPATGGNEKILVIDDDPVQREVSSRLLKKMGYDVTLAESGEKGIELCRSKGFDLLVLDMIMSPGIDGMETYRRILESCPGQKAVMVSGYAESEIVRKMKAMGAGDFIKKPLTLNALTVAVRKELNRAPEKSTGA